MPRASPRHCVKAPPALGSRFLSALHPQSNSPLATSPPPEAAAQPADLGGRPWGLDRTAARLPIPERDSSPGRARTEPVSALWLTFLDSLLVHTPGSPRPPSALLEHKDKQTWAQFVVLVSAAFSTSPTFTS